MTGGQRKVHVILWLVLGPIALAGLVAAVLLRPEPAVQPGTLPGVQAVEPTTPDKPRQADGEVSR